MFLLFKQICTVFFKNLPTIFFLLLAVITFKWFAYDFVLMKVLPEDNGGLHKLGSITLSFLVEAFYTYVVIGFFNSRVLGEPQNIISCMNVKAGIYWKIFVANIVVYASFIAGAFAFVLPGFYLLGRLSFAYFYIYLKGADVLPAVKTSWRETSEYQWWLFSWSLGVSIVFAIFGILVIEVMRYGLPQDLASSFLYNVVSDTSTALLKVFCVVLFLRFYWVAENAKEAPTNDSIKGEVEAGPA